MRSTFAGLNTMVSGINTNQLALDTTGHNISNASTTGYSRQSVDQQATLAQQVDTVNGHMLAGTGVAAASITRARNVYADKQYWMENSTKSYYETRQTNYDKIEAVFNDTDNSGVLNELEKFYKAWQTLSSGASTSSNRVAVISDAESLIDKMKTTATQVQTQINAQYDDLSTDLGKFNSLSQQVALLNKNIALTESAGATANDLRDQRDNLVDEMSQYVNLNVYEQSNGMYNIVSNGTSIVAGSSAMTLELSDPINNAEYGINDFNIRVKEADIDFMPENGMFKSLQDTVAEDKTFIDKLGNMAAFFLTTFNDLHQQGAGIDGTDSEIRDYTSQERSYSGPSYGLNFFGDDNTIYSWDDTIQSVVARQYTSVTRSLSVPDDSSSEARVTVAGTTGSPAKATSLKGMQLIDALCVNSKITATGGQNLIAARTLTVTQDTSSTGAKVTGSYSVTPNGAADGTNAVYLSNLFNLNQSDTQDTTSKRSIGVISLNSYYQSMTSRLGSDSENMDSKQQAQDDLITQIVNWRSSTSGVDWNEELTNMIKFQQGYGACSRCLTTMDEMLDKLINSTGTVGR
jgi:flagellar hook-associated protein 1 FlgK